MTLLEYYTETGEWERDDTTELFDCVDCGVTPSKYCRNGTPHDPDARGRERAS